MSGTPTTQVVGFTSRYAATGEPDARSASESFLSTLTAHYSFATGGSNDHEAWGDADRLADAVFTVGVAFSTEWLLLHTYSIRGKGTGFYLRCGADSVTSQGACSYA